MVNTNLKGIDLYNAAKEAYYNGNPIMEDYEFDELEESLGLANKSYVGAKLNSKYTIKHPFKMGSLSKIQIKDNGSGVNWEDNYSALLDYIKSPERKLIITPKFDGCSFEAVYENGELISVSSRGDGDYGVDLKQHIGDKLANNPVFVTDYVLRGEVLIDKNVFAIKYSKEADPEFGYKNPRSFVSGVLNRDYSDSVEYLEMLKDLSIVIYDVRVKIDGNWTDCDWVDFTDGVSGLLKDVPEFAKYDRTIQSPYALRDIYDSFEIYRRECPYALDGIVIKPIDRINNLSENRPSDCVAIKFKPMLEETEVIDIEWNSVKTTEITPVLVLKKVMMDGRKIERVRGNNYGWLIDNKISIGTKIIVSLAGDIIPFIYKVTDTSKFDKNNLNLPDTPYEIDGIHCNLILTEAQLNQKRFFNSALAVKIPKLGPAGAQQIVDYFANQNDVETMDFFDEKPKTCPDNFLLLEINDVLAGLGHGLTANAVAKGYKEFEKNAKLEDYIIACCFPDCGGRTAAACATYLISGREEFESMTHSAYDWVYDTNSENYKYLTNILVFHGKTFENFKKMETTNSEVAGPKTLVIMTGEPNEWKSKGDFLVHHPEYEQTGSWKKVQIVFTNDMNSKTGKMKKAKELGVEIRLY